MFRSKNDILKEKEENIFTRGETAAIKSLISILINEDFIVNRLSVDEIGDTEAFFNRHQKRIEAMLDFFRGLFVIGYTDEEMLDRMKMFYRVDIEDNLAGLERVIGPLIKGLNEAESKQNEKMDSKDDFFQHGKNILIGLSAVVGKILGRIPFDEFKVLGPMELNKLINDEIKALTMTSPLFKHDWEAAQKHAEFNNFFMDKLTRLVNKLDKLIDEEAYYPIVEVKMLTIPGSIASYIIESDDNFKLDVSKAKFEEHNAVIEKMVFSAVADGLRKTNQFNELLSATLEAFEKNDFDLKDEGFNKELKVVFDWITQRVDEYFLDHNGFIACYWKEVEGESFFPVTAAAKKVVNFFATLDEEGKAMVRNGELLGEYRIEDYPLHYSTNK